MKILQQIVSQVESGGNQFALRFEPSHYEKRLTDWSAIHDAIVGANKCSHSTARMIYSTSWGAYQIMGFNLYAQPGSLSVGEFLASTLLQEIAFHEFISKGNFKSLDVSSEDQLRAFAKFYNGPGNVDEYTRRLVEARDT